MQPGRSAYTSITLPYLAPHCMQMVIVTDMLRSLINDAKKPRMPEICTDGFYFPYNFYRPDVAESECFSVPSCWCTFKGVRNWHRGHWMRPKDYSCMARYMQVFTHTNLTSAIAILHNVCKMLGSCSNPMLNAFLDECLKGVCNGRSNHAASNPVRSTIYTRSTSLGGGRWNFTFRDIQAQPLTLIPNPDYRALHLTYVNLLHFDLQTSSTLCPIGRIQSIIGYHPFTNWFPSTSALTALTHAAVVSMIV